MKYASILAALLLAPLVALQAAEPITNSIGMKLVRIEPGTFTMGQDGPQTDYDMRKHPEESDRADWDEKPVHQVKICKPFHIGATEVTVEQYQQFDPEHRKGKGLPDEAANGISWHKAVEFCQWLSKKEGKTYRLPTEAQWEYACRAGETGPYSGGTLDEVGWYTGNSADKTHQVGQKKPNAWGLHDMHGNVCEWCVDEFFPELKGGIDPVGSDPENPYGCRVVRGGSYCGYDDYEDADVKDYRAANRWLDLPSQRWANFGFRVAIVSSK